MAIMPKLVPGYFHKCLSSFHPELPCSYRISVIQAGLLSGWFFFFLMELLYHSTWTKTKPLFIFLFSIHVTCLFISLHQAGLNGSSFLVLTNKYYISSCLNIIPDWQISYLSLSAQFFHLPLFSQLRFSKKLSHKDSILLLIIVTQYTNINGHLCSPFNNLL